MYFDCGVLKEYIDKYGIIWYLDDVFVLIGKIVCNLFNIDWLEEKVFCYFKGEFCIKNCFIFLVKFRSIYIMRFGFYYGGYDKFMFLFSF